MMKEERKAYYRAYRERHKAEIAERMRAYRERHKAEIAEKRRAYRERHKAEIAENRRAYYQRPEVKERHNELTRKRNADKRYATFLFQNRYFLRRMAEITKQKENKND